MRNFDYLREIEPLRDLRVYCEAAEAECRSKYDVSAQSLPSALSAHDVTLHDFAVLIDTECYRPRSFRGPSEPAACLLTAGLFCGLQSGFGIGMRNLPAGSFRLLHGPARQEGGLIIPTRPDVVRNLRYRRGNKNGLMWIHGPKGNHQMCHTVADALFLPEDRC